MQAFAAPVRQGWHEAAAEQVVEPAGQIAALNVAVIGRLRPAGDQTEGDHVGGTADRILQIQQAKVIFAPFAHHHPAAAFGRVGE